MRKFFLSFCMFAAAMMAHAAIEVGITSQDVPDSFASGDTIVVTAFETSPATGMVQMKVEGIILTLAPSLSVEITRSATGVNDQLCVDKCMNGNGELTQTMTGFRVSVPQTWFTHFSPAAEGDTYITYLFKTETDGEFLLTVCYRYGATALIQPEAAVARSGVWTLLGKQLRADSDTRSLPAGVYIVNGKKQVVR